MRMTIKNWFTATLVLFALCAPLATTPALASWQSDNDRRCLIDLQNADDIEFSELQRAIEALPADCHPRCMFRNISQLFFVRKFRGEEARKNCLLHVVPQATLAPSSGDAPPATNAGGANGNNVIFVYQNGTGDVVAVYQDGSGNWSFSFQDGDGNVVTVHQHGDNNTAGIAQFGNGNSLSLTQTGNNNTFLGVQTDGDSLSFTQTGNQTDVSVQ